MKISLKKRDIILIAVIIIVAAMAFLLHYLLRDTGQSNIVIKVNGVREAVYDLSKDKKIEINGGTNTLVIKNGKADMIEADCKDQVCVKQKAISLNHESIICLPNKVVVEVQSAKESSIDAVTN